MLCFFFVFFCQHILTLFILIDYPIHIDTISMELFILCSNGSKVKVSKLCLIKIVFCCANSADLAIHLNIHCSPI